MLMPMIWRNNDVCNYRNPFEEMDRMFEDFWGNGSSLETTSGMKTDVLDKGDHFELDADLPGFKKEDISVDLKDDVLTISASHNENKDEKDEDGKYIRRERRSSSYSRSFSVAGLKPEDIDAKYENGVLTVNLPKKELEKKEEEAKKIEIK
ncbi:MAG: Hsp20/alpha crystallin family protein [Butyrivibrio sp.]|nr:Hsp20/alpha crystallin family protein [Butyrivibrio sp.]